MRRSGPRLTKIGRPSFGDYRDNFSQMRSADWVLDGVWTGIGGNKKSKIDRDGRSRRVGRENLTFAGEVLSCPWIGPLIVWLARVRFVHPSRHGC